MRAALRKGFKTLLSFSRALNALFVVVLLSVFYIVAVGMIAIPWHLVSAARKSARIPSSFWEEPDLKGRELEVTSPF